MVQEDFLIKIVLLAIVNIKNIDGTGGIVVTYKDGLQVIYENYDKVVDRKGLIKETFSSLLSSFDNLNENLENYETTDIGIKVLYYDKKNNVTVEINYSYETWIEQDAILVNKLFNELQKIAINYDKNKKKYRYYRFCFL